MKKHLNLALLLLVANGSIAEIPRSNTQGIYTAKYKDAINGDLIYKFDSKTNVCMFLMNLGSKAGAGAGTIPCVNLSRRKEWAPIIAKYR